MSRSTKYISGALAACALAAVIGAGLAREHSSPDRIVRGSAYPRWPAETLRDWVGFADQVSIARVASEEQLPASSGIGESGSGYVGRRVVMDIQSTLWRRHGAPVAAAATPVLVDGWWAHDGQLTPYAELGANRVEVGDRVLVALVRAPEGWSVLSSGAVFPLASSKLAPDSGQLAHNPLAVTLRARSASDITRLLESTQPSKAAVANAAADPDARARTVWAEQLTVQSTGGEHEP